MSCRYTVSIWKYRKRKLFLCFGSFSVRMVTHNNDNMALLLSGKVENHEYPADQRKTDLIHILSDT
jgi:hypothetical protein